MCVSKRLYDAMPLFCHYLLLSTTVTWDTVRGKTSEAIWPAPCWTSWTFPCLLQAVGRNVQRWKFIRFSMGPRMPCTTDCLLLRADNQVLQAWLDLPEQLHGLTTCRFSPPSLLRQNPRHIEWIAKSMGGAESMPMKLRCPPLSSEGLAKVFPMVPQGIRIRYPMDCGGATAHLAMQGAFSGNSEWSPPLAKRPVDVMYLGQSHNRSGLLIMQHRRAAVEQLRALKVPGHEPCASSL